MKLKEKIENNIAITFLSVIIVGFIAGYGAHESISSQSYIKRSEISEDYVDKNQLNILNQEKDLIVRNNSILEKEKEDLRNTQNELMMEIRSLKESLVKVREENSATHQKYSKVIERYLALQKEYNSSVKELDYSENTRSMIARENEDLSKELSNYKAVEAKVLKLETLIDQAKKIIAKTNTDGWSFGDDIELEAFSWCKKASSVLVDIDNLKDSNYDENFKALFRSDGLPNLGLNDNDFWETEARLNINDSNFKSAYHYIEEVVIELK